MESCTGHPSGRLLVRYVITNRSSVGWTAVVVDKVPAASTLQAAVEAAGCQHHFSRLAVLRMKTSIIQYRTIASTSLLSAKRPTVATSGISR